MAPLNLLEMTRTPMNKVVPTSVGEPVIIAAGWLIDFGDPQYLAGQRVDRVDICARITEIRRPTVAARADDDGRSNGLACFKAPIRAPTFHIERIHFSVLAADKHAPAKDSRLRDRAARAGEAERPLQFQSSCVGRIEPRHVCRLEAMLRRVDPPSIPMRLVHRIGESGVAVVWACADICRAGSGLLRSRIECGRRKNGWRESKNCAGQSAIRKRHGRTNRLREEGLDDEVLGIGNARHSGPH